MNELRTARAGQRLKQLIKHVGRKFQIGDLVMRRKPLKASKKGPTKIGNNYDEVWEVIGKPSADEYYCERVQPGPHTRQTFESKPMVLIPKTQQRK